MKVWKDKEGKSLDSKEFVSRWKEGVKRITQLQQLKINLFGYVIILFGTIWGLIISYINSQGWLFTILIGSMFISVTQALGIYQRFIIISQFERGNEEIKYG